MDERIKIALIPSKKCISDLKLHDCTMRFLKNVNFLLRDFVSVNIYFIENAQSKITVLWFSHIFFVEIVSAMSKPRCQISFSLKLERPLISCFTLNQKQICKSLRNVANFKKMFKGRDFIICILRKDKEYF
jgi:hypothetical protein